MLEETIHLSHGHQTQVHQPGYNPGSLNGVHCGVNLTRVQHGVKCPCERGVQYSGLRKNTNLHYSHTQ